MGVGEKSGAISGLMFRAEFKPETCSSETRCVDVTWTTGARVRRYSWDEGAYDEELSLDPKHVRMDRLNSGAPFLANHDSYDIARVLGVVQSARLAGNEGVATVRFAKAEDDPEADKVFRKIKDGILRNVSVGYRVHKMEKVEGGSDKTPVYRATDWEPFEISAVPIGADADAGFRSLVVKEHKSMTEQEKRAAEEAAQKAADAQRAAEVAALKVEAAKAERARVAGITSAVRVAKFDTAFADELIASDKTLDDARAAIFARMHAESEKTPVENHQPQITVGEGQREKTLRGAEAALIQRHGMAELVQKLQAKAKAGELSPRVRKLFEGVETDAGEFGGMRPVRIAQEILERAGKSTRGLSEARIIEEAFAARSVAGAQGTSDFTVLLENVMYKQYLGQYELADRTWEQFCKVDSVQDFRNANRYRIGTFGALQSKNENGEFKQMVIPDGLKQVIAAQTKGGIFAITRETLVNDDMGAILATLGEAGNAAGLSIELDVYALLTANSGLGANFTTPTGTQAFFDSSNGNVNATGAALGVDALEADRVQMAKQKDISGNVYLNLRPATLLVPVGLGGQAKVINRMEFDNASSVFQEPNKVRGLFNKVIDTPRLSGTRRYLFSDGAAAIVVAFLNGERSPFMEQRLGWRVDGTEIKIRLDYGVQFFDPKGAVTNAGV